MVRTLGLGFLGIRWSDQGAEFRIFLAEPSTPKNRGANRKTLEPGFKAQGVELEDFTWNEQQGALRIGMALWGTRLRVTGSTSLKSRQRSRIWDTRTAAEERRRECYKVKSDMKRIPNFQTSLLDASIQLRQTSETRTHQIQKPSAPNPKP